MFTLDDVLDGTGGRLLKKGRETNFRGGCVDSRTAKAAQLFFALKGEKADGHDFAAEAVKKGAAGVVLEREVEGLSPEISVIIVSNVLVALQNLARRIREKSPVDVIGITGSTGKTTTKEAITQVLSSRFSTLKNIENQNNEIGLPLTLLGLKESHQVAVLEMGMYALGEIRALVEIAQPRVGVVTNVNCTHIERLGSLERIAQAKAELVEGLPPDGIAILNGDDPMVKAIASKTAAQVLTFGLNRECDVWADEIDSKGSAGLSFQLHSGVHSQRMVTPLVGRHSVYIALAAAAVGLAKGLSWEAIGAGLAKGVVARRRLAIKSLASGVTLVDDSYNASPASMLAAMDVVSELEGARKILVLGDMLELGELSQSAHEETGRQAAVVADLLVTVGRRALGIAQGARRSGLGSESVFSFGSNTEAASFLRPMLKGGDVVLVKGSRGMKMEEIVEGIEQC